MFSSLRISNVVAKKCVSSIRCLHRTNGMGQKIKTPVGGLNGISPLDVSKGLVVLAATGLAIATIENEFQNFSQFQEMVRLAARTMGTTMATQMEYLEHDPEDYDVYIKNPTAKDLPYLLNQFDEHGKEVWPWIWTHPNETGPHFVFVGVNRDTLLRIRHLRSISPTYNILLIASDNSLREAAEDANDPRIYEETHCGIVSDASLELLNIEAKILMLSDERVIAFDTLTIS